MKELIELIKEYKSILWFVGKFFILYVVLNLLYAFYIESYGNQPEERATTLLTVQNCARLFSNESI